MILKKKKSWLNVPSERYANRGESAVVIEKEKVQVCQPRGNRILK